MDNSQIDLAIKTIFDKPFITGFRTLAIQRKTGLNESEIDGYLDYLVDIGKLKMVWELTCKNCMNTIVKYHEKPDSTNETVYCSRCGTEWMIGINDLQKTYSRGSK